ncbi:MAG: hypothetical protein ABR509_05265 [Candidatus Limnocylindria bacterium]
MRLPDRATPALLCLAIAVGCTDTESSPSVPPAVTASPTALVTATAAPTPTPTAAPTPTAVPLSLEAPEGQSNGTIDFRFSPNLPADTQGELLVIVTNTGEDAIAEITLRWPTALDEVLFLAPFAPSPDRMVNPLVVPWTRWVEGPGTRGEPAGTTTLGYGPIDPGTTLEIPLVAEWREPGEVQFDVQFLDREELLLLTDGQPAHVRVDIAPT